MGPAGERRSIASSWGVRPWAPIMPFCDAGPVRRDLGATTGADLAGRHPGGPEWRRCSGLTRSAGIPEGAPSRRGLDEAPRLPGPRPAFPSRRPRVTASGTALAFRGRRDPVVGPVDAGYESLDTRPHAARIAVLYAMMLGTHGLGFRLVRDRNVSGSAVRTRAVPPSSPREIPT
jgi:hypothetical protein